MSKQSNKNRQIGLKKERYLKALAMVLKSDVSRDAKFMFAEFSRNALSDYALLDHVMLLHYPEKDYPALYELASLGVVDVKGYGKESFSYEFPVKLCLESSEWHPKQPAVLRIH